MGFIGDVFTHLFDWEKDPQRQEKIVNARLEAEFDGIDTGLSTVAGRVTTLEGGMADGSVTNAKLANMAQATFKMRAAGAGTGAPIDGTAAQAWTGLMTAASLPVPYSAVTFSKHTSNDDEGGEFNIEIPTNSTLAGNVRVDNFINAVRIYEAGGAARGLSIDLTKCATGAGSKLPVRQVLQDTYTTNAGLTTQIPLDDTLPESTEGTEILSQVITPASASNQVLCEVFLNGSLSAAPNTWIAALFRGTTCIAAAPVTASDADRHQILAFSWLDSPAAATATTYSVRVGPNGALVLGMNGVDTARVLGGAAACTLTVMEIA